MSNTGPLGFFVRHKVAANLLMLVMLMGGVIGLSRMNIQFFPTFALDFVTVRVVWNGAAAEDVEQAITIPLEQRLRSIQNLKNMTSTSAQGVSSITLEFREGTDPIVALDDARHLGAGAVHKERGELADVAEALDRHRLARDAPREPGPGDHLLGVEEGLEAEGHAHARGLHAPADPALLHRLAGDAAELVEVVRDLHHGVFYPRHLAHAGANVRRRHVNGRTDRVFVPELVRVSSHDALEFRDAVATWVHLDSSLRTAEGHIDESALERHQQRECLGLGRVDTR